MALRLGFRQVKGLAEKDGRALVRARGAGFAAPRALWRRGGLGGGALERLAEADAFRSMGLDRRQALWAVKALGAPELPLFAAAPEIQETAEPEAALPAMTLGEQVAADYTATSLSLKRHPLAFLRDELAGEGVVPAAELATLRPGRRVSVAGLVLIRQRPGTASGVIFVTLEDETGIANLVVWPDIFEAHRRIVLGASLMRCTGRLQREGIVIHVVAERLLDLSPRLRRLRDGSAASPQPRPHPGDLVIMSRDFR